MPSLLYFFRESPYYTQTIASVVLVTFVWLLVHPTLLAAQALPMSLWRRQRTCS